MATRKTFGELFANPSFDPIPVGLVSGDLVHAVRIAGADGLSGTMPSGLADQLNNAFVAMRASIEQAGGSLDNIAHVSFFLSDARASMPALNERWTATFPDAEDRPTYKFMPAQLPPGQLVAVEYFGVLGARRRIVQIAGVAHTNPIPMAVRIGDYLFTSRILPMDKTTGDYPSEIGPQIDRLFENLDAVLAQAAMRRGDVVQGRLFLADLANLPALEQRWRDFFVEGGAAPKLHTIRYNAGPALQAMIEVLACAG